MVYAPSCLLLSFLTVVVLSSSAAGAEEASCTNNLKRADVNKDGMLSIDEFTSFLKAVASSGRRGGNVELKCQSNEAKKELKALFTAFADATNNAIEIGAIETNGDRGSIPAQERAVLELLCARCKSFVSKHTGRVEEEKSNKEANNPFFGEGLFHPSNKQSDFDLDAFQFNFAGVNINADIAQEKCPGPWQAAVSCVISDCPQFMDVCPELDVPAANQGTIGPKPEMAGMGNSTGNITNGSIEDPGQTMPEIDVDAVDEIPTCEELEAAFCGQFVKVDYEDCCMMDCAEPLQEVVVCIIQEAIGEDRTDCLTPECPTPAPGGSSGGDPPAPVPSDGDEANAGSGDMPDLNFNFVFMGNDFTADIFQTHCPDELNGVGNCVVNFCPQFLDVCPDILTDGSGSDDPKNSEGNLTVPACAEFVDRGCQSLAFPEGCCLTDCKYEMYKLMLCAVNKTTGEDRTECNIANSCLDPTFVGASGSMTTGVSSVWVNSSFVISNLIGLTAAKLKEELKNGNDGLLEVLQESFGAFVQSVVDTVLAPPERELGQSRGPKPSHTRSNIVGRILASIGFDQGSAQIYDFVDVPCTSPAASATAFSRQGANNVTCIAALGKYRIDVDPEDDITGVYELFVEATQTGISEGKLEETVQRIAQETDSSSIFVVEGVSNVVDNSFDPLQPQLETADGVSEPPPAEMMMDDRCKPQEDALEACVATNNCQECEKKVGEGSQPELPPALAGEGPPEGAPEEIMAQLQGFLTASCDFLKTSSCALKECCPACAAQLDEAYSCLSTNMGEDMNTGFGNLQGFVAGVGDTLGNITDALGDVLGNIMPPGEEGTAEPTAAPVPMPEIPEFTCDFKSVVCEEVSSESTAPMASANETSDVTPPTPAPVATANETSANDPTKASETKSSAFTSGKTGLAMFSSILTTWGFTFCTLLS